ncbi:hypothetical protein BD410DRAFT_744068 [Rickenella mellea]|uniref:Uncharacterized protein n=1 Tax=Rickenella mellea TaxID=50990 RepID=A0A4Y7QC96_9AGAM|nr:hypothetical protein BD410DRAFT_744068 [Rickenella mellea]
MVGDQPLPSSTTDDDGTMRPPIESLSFDILSQIFLDCLPETGLASVSTADAPVLLGRICRHWRAIALGTPQLWAGLDFGHGAERALGDQTKDAMAAAEWKNRAGSCSLSYRLWLTHDGVLDVILQYCSQWRHFEARIEADGWNKVYTVVSKGAPRLRYLAIEILNPPHIHIDIPIPGASQLQSLHIGMDFIIHFKLDHMVTPSLKMLDCERSPLSLDDCWSCLRYFPNLEHFSATCDNGHPLEFSSGIVEAKELKNLQLTLHRAGFDRLLDVIQARSLENLEFNFHHTSDDLSIGVPPIPRFLERSGAHLVYIYIDAPMTSDQIIECFHHTPALTFLELHNGLLNDAVIQALTLVAGTETPCHNICPELERIVFMQDRVNASTLSSDVMKDMILSRWRGEVRQMVSSTDNIWERKLRSISLICLDFEDFCVVTLERTIIRCVEEGLEVVENHPDYYFAQHDQLHVSSE